VLLSAAAARPASGAAVRTVTITLYGGGKALWKLNNTRETSRLELRYRWHGRIRFVVPVRPMNDPRHRHLSVSSRTTLTAGWTGQYKSTKADGVSRCGYKGVRVKARVNVALAKGRAGNTLELRFHPRTGRTGFFSDRGRRALIHCSAGTIQSAPPHFAPSWFFRDNLQDHGRLSSDTAIVVLPSTLLPSGGRATVPFPNERGRNNSVAVGRLAWNNRAETAVRVR
jgi:hypothetical protein